MNLERGDPYAGALASTRTSSGARSASSPGTRRRSLGCGTSAPRRTRAGARRRLGRARRRGAPPPAAPAPRAGGDPEPPRCLSPAFSISQISTLPQPFDDDLRATGRRAPTGSGSGRSSSRSATTPRRSRACARAASPCTNCVGAVPSILPLPLLPGPDDARGARRGLPRWIRRHRAVRAGLPRPPDRPRRRARPGRGAGARRRRRCARLGDEAERAGVRIALEPYQRIGGEDWTIVSTLAEAAALLDEAGHAGARDHRRQLAPLEHAVRAGARRRSPIASSACT